MKKILLSLTFGVFLSLLLLSSLEAFFLFNNKYKIISKPTRAAEISADDELNRRAESLIQPQVLKKVHKKQLPNDYTIFRSDLNFSKQRPKYTGTYLFPDDYRSVVTTTDGRIVYDVDYKFDSLGRRLVQNQPATAKTFLLLVGCSFTFGEGLTQGDTFADRLSELRPDDRVINLGMSGAGPNDLYSILQGPGKKKLSDLQNQTGRVVYIYLPVHEDRVLIPLSVYRHEADFMLSKPLYGLDDHGDLYSKGIAKEAIPFKSSLFKWLSRSAFIDFFSINIPVRPSDADRQIVYKLIQGIRQSIADASLAKNFTFVFYPQTPKAQVLFYRPLLEAAGWQILDYSSLNLARILSGNHEIAGDGHPTEETIWLLSQLIAEDLK